MNEIVNQKQGLFKKILIYLYMNERQSLWWIWLKRCIFRSTLSQVQDHRINKTFPLNMIISIIVPLVFFFVTFYSRKYFPSQVPLYLVPVQSPSLPLPVVILFLFLFVSVWTKYNFVFAIKTKYQIMVSQIDGKHLNGI